MESGHKLNNRAGLRGLLPWRRDFDALETVIVIAIIGVVAAVIVLATLQFLRSATVNAARTEMVNVKSAAFAYYGQHNAWPPDSRSLAPFIQGTPRALYVFDNSTGVVTVASDVTWSWITWSPPPGPPYHQDGKWIR
jgi:type II secretory pathway pseudopilin PulG